MAQDRQRPRRAAEVGPAGREDGAGRDLQRRGQDPRPAAAKAFAAEFGVKWPKAAAKITDDLDVLLGFYDYPAEHWIHLRTTNPIESTFATVRLRTRVTKGPGSRAAGVAMAFKLIESAQTRWRAVNAPHLVALVRAGATFVNGKLVERPDDQDQQEVNSRRREHADPQVLTIPLVCYTACGGLLCGSGGRRSDPASVQRGTACTAAYTADHGPRRLLGI